MAGIGPKSAAQLLNEFQDLEGLYARLAEVPEKWRKKLAAHQEMAFTCREVARLQTGPPAGRQSAAAAADALTFVKRCAGAG
ncbi:DNA polymerase I [Klebsiella pneumoniae]|uniref:DNA polymerase I n=1 Tax=Klebsiella pneumoniae TaxID=573 RepID=A0A377U3F4_KLEPN|nr:DNA polymerase I [Klebsiella pneumoniae]